MTRAAHDVGCVVLAAGGSSRFGSPKQLEEMDGETLVHRAARAAVESGAKVVVLVAGASFDEVKASVSDLDSVIVVFNPHWRDGLASSLRAGLHAISSHASIDGVLLTLADQPLVQSESLRKLVELFDDAHRIVAASHESSPGVPALIGIEFVNDLRELEGDRGARSWLVEHKDIVTLVEMPEAAADVDAPADLLKFRPASKAE